MQTWQPPLTGRIFEPPNLFISLESIGSRPGRHAANEANGGLTRLARAGELRGDCRDGSDDSDRDRGVRTSRRSPAAACEVRHIGISSYACPFSLLFVR